MSICTLLKVSFFLFPCQKYDISKLSKPQFLIHSQALLSEKKKLNLFKNLQIELREEATLPSRPPGFFVQSERMVEKATIFEGDGKERKMAQLTSYLVN